MDQILNEKKFFDVKDLEKIFSLSCPAALNLREQNN